MAHSTSRWSSRTSSCSRKAVSGTTARCMSPRRRASGNSPTQTAMASPTSARNGSRAARSPVARMTSTGRIADRRVTSTGPKAHSTNRPTRSAMAASSRIAPRTSIAPSRMGRTSTSSCQAAWTTRLGSPSRPRAKRSSPAPSSTSRSLAGATALGMRFTAVCLAR